MTLSILIYAFSYLIGTYDVHDIHVSICDVQVEEQKIEITLKTFLDDLQIAIGLNPGEEVPDDYSSAEEMIFEYVGQKIQLYFDETNISYSLGEISSSMEAVWITLETSDPIPAETTSVSLQSTFLTEVYKDQMNLVHFKTDLKTHSSALNNKKTIAIYQIGK